MPEPLRVTILKGTQVLLAFESLEPVDIGRKTREDLDPPSHQVVEGVRRVVIARRDNDQVSRHHVLIEHLEDGKVRVGNQSQRRSVQMPNDAELGCGKELEIALPLSMNLGGWIVRLESREAAKGEMGALAELPMNPGAMLRTVLSPAPLGEDRQRGEALLRWLARCLNRWQTPCKDQDLFEQAARSFVEILDFDYAWVLLHEKGEWRERALVAGAGASRDHAGHTNAALLARVLEEKRVFWLAEAADAASSMPPALVAPILDSQGNLKGALYGHRVPFSSSARMSVDRLAALGAEILAGFVSSGLVQLHRIESTLANRAIYRQYFPAEAVERVLDTPHVLDCREERLTLMSAEVRGADKLLALLGTRPFHDWMVQVFDKLSECVAEHRGTLCQLSDGKLDAMWGAPIWIPDHAGLATKAALAMLERCPELSRRSQIKHNEPFDLGIVLSTAVTDVATGGGHQQFRYGPVGEAARTFAQVRQAALSLRIPLTITAGTSASLSPTQPRRRLGRFLVAGQSKPIELFEAAAPERSGWDYLKATYEEALVCFESGAYPQSIRVVAKVLEQQANDGPSLVLQLHATEALLGKREINDGIIRLD